MKRLNVLNIGLAMTACVGLALSASAQSPFPGVDRGWGRPTPLPQVDGGERFGPFQGLEGEGDFEPNPFGRLGRLLDLTEAQLQSAAALAESHRTATGSLRENAALARAAAREQIESGDDPTAIGNAVLYARSFNAQLQAANAQLRSDLRTLLTPDQQARLDMLEELRGEIGGGGRGGPGRGGRGRFLPPGDEAQ